MTYPEANKLVLMLTYNFAAFMPLDPVTAAGKKGLFIDELSKYDYKRGEAAIKRIISSSPYPPTIYDLKQALGVNLELTRDEAQARLPGPTFESEEGMKAMYTADMDRVAKMMSDLDKELANYGRK